MRAGTRRRLRRAVAQRAGGEPGSEVETVCGYCGVGCVVEWAVEGEPLFFSLTAWTPYPERWGEPAGGLWLPETAHLDHVIPESRNGPTSLDNTVIACAPCNMAKGDSALGDPGFLAWLQQRRLLIRERQEMTA